MDAGEAEFLFNVLVMCYHGYKYVKTRKRKRKVSKPPLLSVQPLEPFKRHLFEPTFKMIVKGDPEEFFKMTNMTFSQYNYLLNLVGPRLIKTSMRKAVDPEDRLKITITYLTQAVSPIKLAQAFDLGASTVRQIIVEVCGVIYEQLMPVYLQNFKLIDWQKIASEFYEKWQMPNCIGSIAANHIRMKCPPKCHADYVNYKQYHSIILFGIVDANYIFTAAEAGSCGSQLDGGILDQSNIGGEIVNESNTLPPQQMLMNSEKIVPHYFVADKRFPLLPNIMEQYSGEQLDLPKQVFNMRLSRVQQIVENAFGVLASRWPILGGQVDFSPKNTEKVVHACVALHNFVKITGVDHKNDYYCPPGFCDSYNDHNDIINGEWRSMVEPLLPILECGGNDRSHEGFQVRETLTEYFMNEGSVSMPPFFIMENE